MLLVIIMVNKLLYELQKRELQKTNQTVFRVEQVTKRKGGKLYVKSEIYNNSFNSWITNERIFY